jgi:cytochrome c peroxidase
MYDPNQTPDISGRFQTGRLSGAKFPFEYLSAEENWRLNRVITDRTVGLEGNSIYFPPQSYVQASLQELTSQEIQNSAQWNVSFLFRIYSDLSNQSMFHWENQFYVEANNGDLVLKGRQSGKWVVVDTIKNAYQKHQWHHFSFNSSPGKLEVFINGVLVKQLSINLDLPSGPRNLWLGPAGSKLLSTNALYSLDEVSISKVRRSPEEIRTLALWKTKPSDLPTATSWTPAQRVLGHKLFRDTRLSNDGTISCATCHQPQNQFADGLKLAVGIGGTVGKRHTPSLWNVGSFDKLMWDGRAKNLAEQALLPIQNPAEMGLPLAEVIFRLNQYYLPDFQQAFGAGPTPENLGQALQAFQETLEAPQTQYDTGALTLQQIEGKGLFFGKARCSSCHQGPLLSDQQLHNLGFLPGSDLGLAGVTGRASDRFKFKTPSLRAIGNTAPYFHDGRFATLDEVIEFYDRGGDQADGRDPAIKPLGLTSAEEAALKAFLLAL